MITSGMPVDVEIVELDGVLYRVERGLSDDAPLVEDRRLGGYPPGRGERCSLAVCRISGWDRRGERPVTWGAPMRGDDVRFAPIAAAAGCATIEVRS